MLGEVLARQDYTQSQLVDSLIENEELENTNTQLKDKIISLQTELAYMNSDNGKDDA